MATTFLLEIVTPYESLLSEEVEEMTATATEGEFGVLAGHTHYLTILKPGELTYKGGKASGKLAVGSGYAEVTPDKTTILVDDALPAEKIDLQAARREHSEAEAALKELDPEDPKYKSASEAVEFAEVKVRVKEG